MKSKKSLITILSSSLFIALATTGISVAWFSSIADLSSTNTPIGGVVQDTYYESGDGTAEHPYVITRPRHLYNLAWLQDLGFYNKHDGSEDARQYYFKLGADIDMSQFSAIPPIGTEQNPFAGNFNGDGHEITGVTISNQFSDYVSHPSVISAWNGDTATPQPIEKPHILGLFGVVGDYSSATHMPTGYESAINELANTAISGATVKTVALDSLVGIAAGYVEDSNLSDTHHMLKNVIVDDSSISLPSGGTTSYGSDTSGNDLEDISEYSLVGYTNDTTNVVKASKTMYGLNIDSNIVYAATEEGNIAGWGGSVNMKEMYTRLDTIWNGFKKNGRNNTGIEGAKYYANKEVFYDKNGVLDETKTVESNETVNRLQRTEGGVFPSGSSNRYHTYYNHTQEDSTDHKTTASYGFIIEEETSNEEDFMCLTGNKIVTIAGGQTLKTNYYDSFYGKKIYIDINNNRYYLKTNSTNDVTATTDPDEASLWMYEDNSFYTEIDDVQYFLNRSGTNTVNLGTTLNTIWNYDSENNAYFTTYNNENYYLNCTTSDWNLTTMSNIDHILLSDGNGNYIAHPSGNSDGNATVGTNKNSNTVWWYQNGTSFVSTSGGNRYLRSDYNTALSSANTSDSSRNMYVSNTNSRVFTINNDGYLYTTYNAYIWSGWSYQNVTHHVYAYWNGSAWKETIATGSANPPANRTLIVVEKIGTLAGSAKNITFSSQSSTASYLKRDRTETVDAQVEVNHTFFPLREADNKPGVPDDSNTGYVVSGGNYFGDPYGDIRVSRYAKSGNLSTTCYNNGTLNTVYTINASGTKETVNANNFKKYTAAKSSMENVLSGDSNIYGLHFMNASIHYGGTNPAIAEKAVINGTTYYNYELPTDCVDFNLKEKGFINFFAGTYYDNGDNDRNNSFFSLNEVIRNGSSITNIKEIKGVYSDPSDASDVKSYVYLYDDDTYSVPFKYTNGEKTNLDGSSYVEHSTQNTCPSGYTLSFATSRIKKQSSSNITTDFAYYFEIPMNEGEYCLGSVSDGVGAYLMYLDIAANAAKTNRTIFYERFKLTKSTYSYPTGVSLKAREANTFVYDDEDEQYENIDASDSTCMAIQAGANGVFGMDRSGNDVTLTRANTNKAPPNYSGENIDLVHDLDSAENIIIVALSESDRWIKQMEYYDYMIISDTLIVTTITDVSANSDVNSAYTRQSIVQKQYGGNSTSGTLKATYTYINGGIDQRSSMKVYNHSGQGRRYSVDDLGSTTVINIAEGKLRPATDANIVLVFNLFQDGGDSYIDSSTVSVTSDGAFAANGSYYTYNSFVIVITPDSGTINIEVTTLNSTFSMVTTNVPASTATTTTQTVVITINGTPVTGEGDIISIS